MNSEPARADGKSDLWHKPRVYHTIVGFYMLAFGTASLIFAFIYAASSGYVPIVFLGILGLVSIPSFVLGLSLLIPSNVGAILSIILLSISVLFLAVILTNGLSQRSTNWAGFGTPAPLVMIILLCLDSLMLAFLLKGWRTDRATSITTKGQKIVIYGFGPAAIVAMFVAVSIPFETQVNFQYGNNFEEPTGATIDNNGYVYVADPLTNRIIKFDSKGHLVSAWSSHGEGRLASDLQSNIYAINGDTQQARKYNSYGVLLNTFGPPPSGPTSLGVLDGIAVDSKGNVFVTNSADDEIKEYSSTGGLAAKWNSIKTPSGNESLISPESVAIDKRNYLFVRGTFTDPINHTEMYSIIYKFKIADNSTDCIAGQMVSANICYLTEWKSGQGRGIAVDSRGHVFIGDGEGVNEFTSDGSPIKTFCSSICDVMNDLAIDKNDYFYTVNAGAGREQVVKFTSDDKVVLHIGSALYSVK